MENQIYDIRVRYLFEGVFSVRAENRIEARRRVDEDCGAILGSVQSTLGDGDVDWEFPVHPESVIVSVKKCPSKRKPVANR